MKKILSLLLAVLMLGTVIGTTPTVFAEEFKYPLVSDEIVEKYWGYLYYGEIVKIGDWYYGINKSAGDDDAKFFVCGYDGKETEITIPIQIDGYKIKTLRCFYLISDTVETIKIPKEIERIKLSGISNMNKYIGYNETTKLKEIIVDNESTMFESKDGVLFSKGGWRLIFYPPQKTDETYTVPSYVYRIMEGAICYQPYLKSLTIPQSVTNIFEYAISPSLDELYFDNTNDIIGLTTSYLGCDPGDIKGPEVPNGTIYCIYGTPLYEYYNKPENKGIFYKELKVIPRKGGESLIKEDGVWYYYDNGEKTNRSTLIKHSGKWFYVENGVWDKTVTDRIISYKDKWFYIKNGKWNSSTNTLVKIDGEWLGIENGKWDNAGKTLIKYKGKWFYINNGKWDSSAKTLTKYKGKWFYIKNGKWCKDTAIVKYKGKRFYVKNGKVDFDYSGSKKIDGKTYKIKNGKVA